MKKITIIAPSSFGYINFLVDELKNTENVTVTHINFSEFKYKYTSILEKVTNAFRKVVFKKNIKKEYRSNKVLELVSQFERQEYIVVIRPDQLDKNILHELKKNTDNFYAFYFDAISNFPEKIGLIPIFDKVFSYEKTDVEKYNLEFVTNYIYDEVVTAVDETTTVFNISSFDERYGKLEKIAQYLKDNEILYSILVRKENTEKEDLLKLIPFYKSLEEVKELILSSKVLLDVQKDHQFGLSFRVFEALGYQKKLITTNVDVVNYPFYNPNNIVVVDVDNIVIPASFFKDAYIPIAKETLYPYTLKGWIEKVFV